MMKKILQRLFSLLLAVCMVLPLLPTAAAGGGLTGNEITIDVSRLSGLTEDIGNADTLWLYDASEHSILVKGGSVSEVAVPILTLTGANENLSVVGESYTTLNLVLDGAQITGTQISVDYGSLTIQDGSVVNLTNTYGTTGAIYALYADVVIDNSTVTVTSGTSGLDFGLYPKNLTICNGSTVNTVSGIYTPGKLTITDSTVNAVVEDGSRAGIAADGAITVTKSRVTAAGFGSNSGIRSNSSSLTISGGTVVATGGVSQYSSTYGLEATTIVIQGASVNATASKRPTAGAEPSSATLYKTTLAFPEAGADALVTGAVGEITLGVDDNVRTDAKGFAYLWLPEGEAAVDLTAGIKPYKGNATVTNDDRAVWPVAVRTVTFDAKGGSDTAPAQTAATGKLTELPSPTQPDGYTLDGWYTEYYGGEKITTDTLFMVDTTVYARWVKEGVSTDADRVDVSKLTVSHTETGAWEYDAVNKKLTVSGNSVTLTGENNNLSVAVTGSAAAVRLDGVKIATGAKERAALQFTDTSGTVTLEIKSGTESTLTANGYNGHGIICRGTLSFIGGGKLTVVASGDYSNGLSTAQSPLVIDGPEVSLTGRSRGASVAGGVLNVTAGGLTANKTGTNYTDTLSAGGTLTLTVSREAFLTVLGGGTGTNTTVVNDGGTVYIDGNVSGTAHNISGSFVVTGAVSNSEGIITKPTLPEVSIDLSSLSASTEYYEVVDSSQSLLSDTPYPWLTGYKVIRIKKAAEFTLTGAAPVKHILLDTSTQSEYILNGISIGGLIINAYNVTVNGVNGIGEIGIPVVGGTSGSCNYSGTGTLNIVGSHIGSEDERADDFYAFGADESGKAVLNGCTVNASGFYGVSDALSVKSGSIKGDGFVWWIEVAGGSADIGWQAGQMIAPTIVHYTGGELKLRGFLDSSSSRAPDTSAIFNTNDGSAVPNQYVWGEGSCVVSQPPVTEKAGSAFMGWYSDEGMTVQVIFPDTIAEVAKNYYAKWDVYAITITNQPQAATVPYGSDTGFVTVTASVNNGSLLSYQWYRNGSNSNTGGTLIAGATGKDYHFPTSEAGTAYYYCEITAPGCAPVTSDAAAVTVEKGSYIGPTTGTLNVRSGEAGSYTYTLPALPQGMSYEFSYVPAVVENSSVTGNTLSFQVNNIGSGQTSIMRLTILGGANYNNSSFGLALVAVDKTLVNIALTVADAVYDKAAHGAPANVSVTENSGGAAVTGVTPERLYESTDGQGYSGAEPPISAGRYRLTLSMPESSDYTGSNFVAFTIGQRPVTVRADDKTVTKGDPMPAFTYTVVGQLEGDTALSPGPQLTCTATDTSVVGNYFIGVDISGMGYTSNYMMANPIVQSGTLFVVDVATPDPGPGTGTGTVSPTAPVVADGTATARTEVTATVGSDGKATASVTQTQVSDAVSKAKEAAAKTGEPPRVEIKAAVSAAAKSVAATLPKAAVQSLVSGGIDSLTLTSPVASMTFSAESIAAIAGAASGDVTFTASRVENASLTNEARLLVGTRPVFDLSVTSGGKAISEFGGSVTAALPYTPAAGEDVNAIVAYYINGDGKPEPIGSCRYDAATGALIFTTTHFSSYAVGYNKVSFSDVASGDWYYTPVSFIAARGITNGMDGRFNPDGTLTRGQFITMLLRAYGIDPDENPSDSFADGGNTYYTGYLAAAKRLGIAEGMGDNLYMPERAITRQEMFKLLYGALKVLGRLPEGNSGRALSDFSDAGQIDVWAKEAMTALVKSGVISGDEGMLTPTGTSSRSQMAQVLYNLLGK